MSCEDIPSLLDLQKVKKHAEDFGRLMGTGNGTSTNGVTGQVRPTYNKVINDMNSEFDGMIVDMNSEFDAQILNMGFTRIGTFASGATIANPRQTLLWDVADGGDGQEYGWSGAFPLAGKVVPAGSTPLTTGGISVGAWMSRFDPALRVQTREALRRSYAEAGRTLVAGSFEAGGTASTESDVLLYEADGKGYSWGGVLPKIVPTGSTPVSSGGLGAGEWTDRSSSLLSVHVRNFGAVGNGIADDTAAAVAAIRSGRALDWGGPENVYRITSTIALTIAGQLQWKANGAKVLFDSAASSEAVFKLTLPDTVHAIDGKLIIDANRKAFSGFQAVSVGVGANTDITAVDLEVRNIYRSSTAFLGGDGISLRGGWRNISLIRPVVTNCKMAAGAGVFGSQGIFGITISGVSGNSAQNVYIENPYIDGVWSEDPAYVSDQDGIRVFNADNTTDKPFPASFELVGGKIKDCRGRSVKTQTENGRIQGLQLVRTTAANSGNPGVVAQNADIEFQTGGGSVSDIEFHYDGFVPQRIVRFLQSTSTLMKNASPANLNGLRGVILGTSVLPAAVLISASSVDNSRDYANVSGINIDSETAISSLIAVTSQTPTNKIIVNLSNCFAPISDQLVSLASNCQMKRVYGTNVHNTADTLVSMQNYATVGEYVSLLHSSGFKDSRQISGSGDNGPFTRVHAIAPDGVADSGILRPIAFTVADGVTFQLPATGAGNGVHMLFVSVAVGGGPGRNAQAIFSVNSGGVAQITNGGTEFSVGSTTEPQTGNYRLWGSGSTTLGPWFSNHSGESRTITCLQFG